MGGKENEVFIASIEKCFYLKIVNKYLNRTFVHQKSTETANSLKIYTTIETLFFTSSIGAKANVGKM